MDSVNPDYIAAWIQRGQLDIPAWIYPDNYFAGIYKYPLLNSLYGGNSTAYLAALFFYIFGYGVVEVHLYHIVLGILLLLSLSWCLVQWRIHAIAVALFAAVLASDPTYIYAWRTQYYLQLYPLIWFFLGVGLLSKAYYATVAGNYRESCRIIFFSGILLGFSVYSYFIFAIYVLSIVLAYFFYLRKDGGFMLPFFLIAGIFLGFIPYVYAHLSIILNSGFGSYITSIKGLQGAYNVIDVNQGGIFEKLSIVGNRLESLVLGEGVMSAIFGRAQGSMIGAFVVAGFLVVFLIIYLLDSLKTKIKSAKGASSLPVKSVSMLCNFLLLGIILHLSFGLLMGRPLGTQHYIMIVPMAYAACAAVFSRSKGHGVNSLRANPVRAILVVASIALLIFNLSATDRISNQLNKEGGNNLYSDVINKVGAYIDSLPTETAILFPQWGYWMGALVITGPKLSMYQTSDLDEMSTKLKIDPKLLAQDKFLLVLGQEYTQGSVLSAGGYQRPKSSSGHKHLLDNNQEESAILSKFIESNGLVLGNILTIVGRNGIDKVLLVHLSRR